MGFASILTSGLIFGEYHFSDVYTYQGSDIFYWINGVGGKVAETKNIFAKWAETSTP